MQQVLDCFREADISLSYDIGANGDIGAEGLVTIGAGASVSVGLNPELLLMLVGLDSPTHEGQGSIGIDLSLDMEAGVSVGEFAELAITGGGGVSTNLLSVEVTEWDDAIPTFYEDRSASNANLSDVKVYTSYPVTPSLALTPPLDSTTPVTMSGFPSTPIALSSISELPWRTPRYGGTCTIPDMTR
jgi:hypothetical protein